MKKIRAAKKIRLTLILLIIFALAAVPAMALSADNNDAETRIALERSLREELTDSILSLLTPVYGRDGIRAAVWLTLGFDDITTESSGRIPPADGDDGGATADGVDTLTRVQLAKGYVTALSVSINIDSAVLHSSGVVDSITGELDEGYASAVRALVAAAVGAQEDAITIESLPFSAKLTLNPQYDSGAYHEGGKNHIGSGQYSDGSGQYSDSLLRSINERALGINLLLIILILLLLAFAVIIFRPRLNIRLRPRKRNNSISDAPSVTAMPEAPPEMPAEAPPSSPPKAPRFDFLRRASAADIIKTLEDEHPQTAALTLSYLSPKRGAEVLAALPESDKAAISARIANMQKPSAEYVKEAERVLKRVYSKIRGSGNKSPRGSEKTPPLRFEELSRLPANTLRLIVRASAERDLAAALRLAPENISRKLYGAMPKRLAETVRRLSDEITPVSVREVDAARRRIADIANGISEEANKPSTEPGRRAAGGERS